MITAELGAFQIPQFWMNYPPPPPATPPGDAAANQPGTSSPSTPSTSQIPVQPMGMPLFTPASFNAIIPLPPVPVPPPNLSLLSEEELRQMEGDLRQAVEARIETLRRVQLLLDAAMATMGQYQTAVTVAKYV